MNTADAKIKIEVSPVWRGLLLPPAEMPVCERVEMEYGFTTMSVVSLADLYGGKICAALDRQHPRDLFDVLNMLGRPGLTREIFDGFLCYLAGHPPSHCRVAGFKLGYRSDCHVIRSGIFGDDSAGTSLESLLSVTTLLPQALKSHLRIWIASSCSVLSKTALTGRGIAILKFSIFRLFAGSNAIWRCLKIKIRRSMWRR